MLLGEFNRSALMKRRFDYSDQVTGQSGRQFRDL